MAPRRVCGRSDLISFLIDKVRVVPDALQDLLAQIHSQGSGHLENVALSDEFRSRQGMVAPAEGIPVG